MSPIPAIIFLWNTTTADALTGKEEQFTYCFFQGTYQETSESEIDANTRGVDNRFCCDQAAEISPNPSRGNVWSRQESFSSLRPPLLPQRSMDDVNARQNIQEDFLGGRGIQMKTARVVKNEKKSAKTTSSSPPRRIRRIRSDIITTEESHAVAPPVQSLSPRMPVRRTSVQDPSVFLALSV